MSKVCQGNNCTRPHNEDGDLCPICKSRGHELNTSNTQTQNSNDEYNKQN